ncbi:MAG: hypothetical protein MUE44_35900 [Oscillatoriaceae cyanobacterium Prado104]|jgi:hypothetical protein|nr:hypothetical protein [Oscillatoriaceae cyanobacterium Prado104]
MVDDFTKYERMEERDVKPEQVYLIAEADGLDFSTSIRMLRRVYNLSLIEAKEVSILSKSKADSLIKHQEKLLPSLEKALNKLTIGDE